MPPSWLRRFMRGEIIRLRGKTLGRLAAALGLPLEVVRLGQLCDEAGRLLQDLEQALAEAAPHLHHPEEAVGAIANRARSHREKLALRPRVDYPAPEFDQGEWERTVASLTPEQKRAIVRLVAVSPQRD